MMAPHHERLATLLRRVVFAAAVWSLISIPLRGRQWHWPLAIDRAFGLLNAPAEPSLFTVAVMFLLAGALRRRLRAALLVVVIFESVVGVLQLVALAIGAATWDHLRATGLGIDRARVVYLGVAGVIGLAAAAFAWSCRQCFTARLRSGAVGAAIGTLFVGIGVSAALNLVLVEAFPGTLSQASRLWWSVRVALGALTDIDGVPHMRGAGQATHWIAALGGLCSALAVLAAVWVFTRSARAKQFLGAGDELAVRRLLHAEGERDSLGYFATRRDKSVIFSKDGRAALGYRVVASVSLASADPIGAVAAWPSAIDAWLAEARAHGWFPAVLASGEHATRAYVAAGMKALALGDEAIIDVDGFTLRGPAMRPVRQAVTRIRRAGYTAQIRRHGDIPATEMAELAALSERWRGNATERGFSMALGRLGDPADERCVTVTAHDRNGDARGLLSFVPWGTRGLSLELMRRDRNAENGLIEYLVAALIAECPGIGVVRVSLNFAMFRSVFGAIDKVGAGPVVRLSAAVLSVASRFWQVESLYRSNAKYQPEWVPRYLCYDPALSLTRAAVAAGMAEGFLPSPRPPAVDRTTERTQLPDGSTVSFDEAVRKITESAPVAPAVRRLTQQQHARRAKIDLLRRAGYEAYPAAVERTSTVAELHARYDGLPAGQHTGENVSVAGRVSAARDFGGVTFAVVHEGEATIQLMLCAEATPARAHLLWRRAVDLGDQVSVTGEVVASKRGELSVLVDRWAMAAKCLHPLPDPRRGFTDPEARVRQRHLDLLVNPDARALLAARSVTVDALRDGMRARGFVEVETPILQSTAGGAAARPFRTRSHAYDTDLFLRVAPELQLKRLCVAGLSSIFELGRDFRNEGADATHNPEFTVLEAYQAWSDYHGMRELIQSLLVDVARRVNGEPVALRSDGQDGLRRVELGGDWPVVTVHDAVSRGCGERVTPGTSLQRLQEIAAQHGVRWPRGAGTGELVLALYEALVEKQTHRPTFYVDFPLDVCPLARTHRDDPRLAERWDLVAFGMEIATAYSELTDPIDQRARLLEQAHRAALGDPEAMELDETFLAAMEYAMPPTGGLGIGVDRLVMLLTGASIRATLAFPFARPSN